MLNSNPWQLSGQWYRGIVHCHTTESDGQPTPQETVDWYASHDYDFLAITDHNRVTDPGGLDHKGLCLITATELTAAGGELGASYHLLGINVPPTTTLPAEHTLASESVAFLRSVGATVFIAHPYWSGLTASDLLALWESNPENGAAGIEVYNGASYLDSQKGESLASWDETLARGARFWGIATDDTHWGTLDRGLGWVMVRAPALSPGAITTALDHGHFYASSGPEFRQIKILGQDAGSIQVYVETSPCAAIYLLAYGDGDRAYNSEAISRGDLGATITEATLAVSLPPEPVAGDKRSWYMRVQATDWQRRSAWSNPIFSF